MRAKRLALVAACLAAASARIEDKHVREGEVIVIHVGKTCGGSVIDYMRRFAKLGEIHLRPVVPSDLDTAPLVVVVVRDPVDRVISAFNWHSPNGGKPITAAISDAHPRDTADSILYDCFSTVGAFADAVGAFAARPRVKTGKHKTVARNATRCEQLAAAFLAQDDGARELGLPVMDYNKIKTFAHVETFKKLTKEQQAKEQRAGAPGFKNFYSKGHISRGLSWYLTKKETRAALKKKNVWMVQTANCANDTTGAVEWLSRRGDARNEQQALEHVNERKGKKRRELPRFPQEHKVNVYEDRGEKYGGTVTRTPEQEAVLETKLPADSTDKRVVRRRAALAAALAYEYERMNWLVGFSINYRVDGEGVPRPDDSWKR
mmetsp:Transcript_27756/g.83507  ORF Transcript_27756/g.83507 Transcript_27756/m.83507 type:complete len:376 (+) Transcript_27756:1111-2238(+)